jgi:hypothetical protein
MEVKNLVIERGRFQVLDGSQTRFWEDLWLGKEPFSVKFPALYNLVKKKSVSVAQVLSTTPLNVSFRRALVGVNWDNWCKLVGSVLDVNLSNRRDTFVWTASKKFSVRDLYDNLVLTSGTPVECGAWKAKLSLKIKIFLWYLKKGVVLTKDNLAKRKWKGCTKCCFCGMLESIQHLFFDCPMAKLVWEIVCLTFGIRRPYSVEHLFGPWLRSFSKRQRNLVMVGMAAFCWAIWISRNDIVFHKSRYMSVLQVMFRGTHWIRSWSILSREEGRYILKEGCRWVESVALEIFHNSGWNAFRRIGC